MPEELIQKVLRDVPQEWSRHMINDKGVERHDVTFYSGSVVNEDLVNSLDYLIGFEIVLDRLLLLEQNIDTLKSLPNGRVVVDEVTGYEGRRSGESGTGHQKIRDNAAESTP